MTIGDVIGTVNQNKELLGSLLGIVLAAIFGKRRYDQAKATFDEKLAKALALADQLVAHLVRADALTQDAIERLDKEWKPAFEAVARALHWDITPKEMAAIMEKVRNHLVTVIAAYTKHRTDLAVDHLEKSAKKWDYAIDVVLAGHLKKLAAAAERTRKAKAARMLKSVRAKEKALRRATGGG